MRRRKSRGFTLLEILAVLAVMGMAMGLIFPGFSAIRNSSLRHLTTWRFLEMVEALEEYRLHYGHHPSYLQKTEYPIALADPPIRDEFIKSLSGTGSGPVHPSNPDNCRFFTFQARDFDGNGFLKDAFGGKNIFLMGRAIGKSTIPREAFPESIREWVPDGGVGDELVFWSLGEGPHKTAVSWR
jgi:prepilin-type N-terminal cleavage/methylation domain-containing protein